MNSEPGNPPRLRVALLGAFPPQAQGIHDYCGELAAALGQEIAVHAVGFRAMYPAALFPGVKTAMDPTKSVPQAPHLHLSHRLAWYHPLGWLWQALTTPCDVFHAQWWSLPLAPVTLLFLLVMKLRGKPVVVTGHNVLPHEPNKTFLRASAWIYGLADRVIVHSAENREQLHRHYHLPESKTCVLPMGVFTDIDRSLTRAGARQQLGIPGDAQVLLFFGIIREYKGVDHLIEAFAQLKAEFPAAQLHICGKPWLDWSPYAERIARHGLEDRVHTRLEYIPAGEIPAIITAADLLLLPYTHFDAQSAVGAQLLPYRVPTIVSRVGGLPDWVNGDSAWTVPPGNAGELAARMRAVLGDYEGARARYRVICDVVLERYSWKTIAREHVRIYAAVGQAGR
ncbi:MAG: glycosyltransferase family 4 protein [Candidatus Hydrogenedentes bacterium]|nr:glycosyltransferase family 4 protein [Candidatus Hydrogenedentota bacterium]